MGLREVVIHHGRKLGEYNATFTAQLTVLGSLVAALLGVSDILPEGVVGPTLALATASATVSAWARFNQDRIDRAGDNLADLVEKYWGKRD